MKTRTKNMRPVQIDDDLDKQVKVALLQLDAAKSQKKRAELEFLKASARVCEFEIEAERLAVLAARRYRELQKRKS